MFPRYHLIASLIAMLILFPIYKFWTIGILIGGFLIDVDHYIWYVLRKKDFSLKNAYIYSLPKNRKYREKDILHIFHVWEFWILMLILASYNLLFAMIFLGILIHLIMDFIHLHLDMKNINSRAFSFFMWLKRH